MPTPLKILIAEDNPTDADLLLLELDRAGFATDWQRVDTEEGFLAGLHAGLDLVISDYEMPQFSGLRAIELLNRSGLAVPLIIVSGTIGEETAVQALKLGARDYLLKDRLGRLGPAVSHVVEQSRLHAERVLDGEQLRLQGAALAAAANAILITDRSGTIVWANAAFTTLTGYTGAETIGKNPRDLVKSGEQDDAVYRHLWETIMAGRVWHGELVNRRKDGRLYPEEQTITPVHDATGAITHFIAIKQDLTERKRQQGENARLVAILEATPDLVSFSDPTGKLLYFNPAGRKLLGIGPNEDITRNVIADFIPHPAANPILSEGIPAAIRAGAWSGEAVLLKRDGTEFPVSQVIIAHKGPDGKPEFLSTIMRDISAQKQAVAALRTSEQHFRVLFEQAAVGVALADARTGRFVHVNQRYADILGRSREETERLTFIGLTHPDDLAFDLEMRRQILSEHTRNYSREKRYRRKDGSDVWVNLTVSAMWAPGDSPDYFIAVVQDITERKQLEEQYRQSQKMEAFGQLAGGVAHDFNNILAVTMMQAQLSTMAEGVPPAVLKGLHLIAAASERGSNLTRQLLLFSHKQVMQPRDVDLNEIVTSLAKMLQRIIEENVRLELHLHPNALITHADAGMLDQILMNFTVNARDAMPGGGRLEIKTAERIVDANYARQHAGATPGRFVCLSVSDSGTGIPAHVLPRIFEPFFTTKGPGKGTGLGLATVFGIVKQHRGWVEVETGPGRGTAFHVFLPASATPPAGFLRAPEPLMRGGTETILLVEDDPGVRLLTRAVLERAGYRILEAHDGVEALRIWEQQRSTIALLFTDIIMPGGVSGHELAARLQADDPKLRIVFTSGYNADVTGSRFIFEEGRNFIQKPSTAQRLLETIRSRLDN